VAPMMKTRRPWKISVGESFAVIISLA